MLPCIFVGGTGRSGTTIITKILGTHSKIFSFPLETRFIIDPDGIKNIISNFSYSYNSNRADMALHRFEKLMLGYLINPNIFPYRGYDFRRIFGEKFYIKTVNDFCNELRYKFFIARDYLTIPSLNPRLKQLLGFFKKNFNIFRNTFEYRDEKIKINLTKKFTEKEILVKSANFINTLFMKAAKDNGKKIWCEKTPSNILDIALLFKLFPNAKFIHIKRDPREVVYSLITRNWAPKNVRDASLFLKSVLERLHEALEEISPLRKSYLEITLESLVNKSNETLEKIDDFLKVENEFSKALIKKTRVGYWKSKLTKKQIEICEKILGDLIVKHGYKLT